MNDGLGPQLLNGRDGATPSLPVSRAFPESMYASTLLSPAGSHGVAAASLTVWKALVSSGHTWASNSAESACAFACAAAFPGLCQKTACVLSIPLHAPLKWVTSPQGSPGARFAVAAGAFDHPGAHALSA